MKLLLASAAEPFILQLHQRSVELAEAVSASQVPDVREHLPFTIISSLDLSPDTQVDSRYEIDPMLLASAAESQESNPAAWL